MYSTVIEGLKYASSHEWYVHRNSHPRSLGVNFRFGFSFCGVREHIFLLSFSLSLLSLCDAYISYAHRVNESEGDEFGRRKREREREREKRENARAKFTCFIVMRDDPNKERDGWIIRPRESFRFKKLSSSAPRRRIFFSFSQHVSNTYFLFLFLSNDRAKIDGDVATVGITDHAQAELGDIVYVELPEVGSAMEATKSFGVVESVKAASDVYSPISGTVIEINEALNDSPGTVNDSPFEGGWLMKVKVSDVPGSLMDAAAYEKSIA